MSRLVSVVVPIREERSHIDGFLNSLEEQDYQHKEVFLVDGMSTDGTRACISEFIKSRPQYHMLDNPDQVVPHALNKAIKESNGDIILRMDCHCEYPSDYISRLVTAQQELGAENVGGVWHTKPGAETAMAKAIVAATTSAFGIGNAAYRFSENADVEPRQVDTVPYGCYRREVFDRIGLFDEELVRNQDDEFNGRLIKDGGRIFLLPDLKIIYFARPTAAKLSRMFFEYGLFKPLVNRKLGSPATLRQFFPPGLLLFALLFVPFVLLLPKMLWACLALWMLYGGAAVLAAWSATGQERQLFPTVLLLFPLIHFSYGWGYLKGLFWTYLHRAKYKQKFVPNR